jgi:hypothetical protein
MADMTPEGKLLELIKQAQGKLRLRKELKIFTKINIALTALIVVILVFLLKDIFRPDYKLPELAMDMPEQTIEILTQNIKFTDAAENPDQREAPLKDISAPKEEIAENFSLLGIVSGETAQVIIEDKKKGKTFFLYQGDDFGDFTVSDIRESSVTLDYKGEKIELNI